MTIDWQPQGIARVSPIEFLSSRHGKALSEVKALLTRIVVFAVEDKAWTPGSTRLARAILEAKRLLGIPDGGEK